MAYVIVNKFIPESKYPLKAPYAMTPEYVTIHNTANDASALNEISYMTTNSNATSYHVAIDDVHAVQGIPFRRNAYHAGDGQGPGNRKSIGIEICYSKSGGPRYYAAEANAVEYVAGVLKQYGWGIDRIKWHRDWSGKHCPHRIIDEGRLNSFKAAVKAHMNGTVKPAAKPQLPKETISLAEQKNAQASASLAKEVALAKEAGITDGTFLHRTATREEVAAMNYRVYEKLKKDIEELLSTKK
ncbi:N-acetylmuramoyl-L-alanine amidase CwlA precursor [Lysinibacillus sphaericus]|nr:N-acetylmuramoyl-L-alanine amidase CwlA precursor [Lysinibacillus sphaericus]